MKKLFFLVFINLALSINVTFGQSIPSYIPANGLIGWWPFSGNANDYSGNNLNGTVIGASLTPDRFGNPNSAYNFNYATVGFGTQTNEIYIPFSPILNSPSISISMWVYQRQYFWSGNNNPPMSTLAARFQYGYSNPNGEVWMLNSGTNGINGFASAPNITLNSWTHIVTTYENGTGKIYINGQLLGTHNSMPALNINGNSGISIGESNQANGYWWPTDGVIDDIGMWNRALTQQEIVSLYQGCLLPETAGIITGATSVNQNQTKTYSVPSILNATSYQWTLPPGATGNSDSNSIIVNFGSIAQSGFLKVRGVNSCGAGDSTVLMINVLPTYFPINGLVAWYPFIGNANDESGNGHNGIIMGSNLVADRNGNPNSAYSFNGVNNHITIQHNSSLTPTSGSVSAWIKTYQNISGQTQWLIFGQSWGRPQLAITANRKAAIIWAASSSVFPYANSTQNVDDGNWHFVVGVWDSNSLKIYVDGVLENASSTTYTQFNCNSPIQIGGFYTTATYCGNAPTSQQYFNGIIDDIGLWNRALTQSEITNLYQGCTNQIVYDTVVSCNSFYWNANNQLYLQSGVYYDTVSYASGCDSINVLNLTIINSSILQNDTAICAGDTITLSALLSNTNSSTLPSSLSNGLVGWWPFNGNANDESGNGNNGTIYGATLINDRHGNINKAYSFDGINDYIICSNNGIPTSGNKSISVWLKPNQNMGIAEYICLGSPSNTTWGTLAGLNWNGSPYLTMNYGRGCSGTSSANIAVSPYLNIWQHIVYISSGPGGICSVYVNGVLAGQANNGIMGSCSSQNLYFGVDIFGPNYVNCEIDDIGIWNRPLTQNEIMQLYQLGEAQYHWSTNDTTPTIKVSPALTTKYYLTSSANGVSCTDSITIYVNQPPPAIAGIDRYICKDSTTQIGALPNSGNTYSWSSNPPGFSSFLSNPIVSPTTTTTYTLTETDTITACSQQNSVVVTVVNLTVNAGSDKSIICGGNTVLNPTYTYNGNQAGLTWSWLPSLGLSSSNTQNTTANPTQSAKYHISVSSPEGCYASDSLMVNVNPIALNAGQNLNKICGEPAYLNPALNYPGNNSNISWLWHPSIGLNDTTIRTPIATPSITTTYNVSLVTTEGCIATDTLTISVTPASLAAGADKTIICGGSETINPIVTFGGNQSNLTWSWSPAIGLSSTNIKTPTASPVQTQAYQVSYSSPEGCTAMDSITIFVSPVSLNAGSDVTKLCGDSVVLNPTTNYPGSNSNLSWTWTPASGLNSPTTQNATAKPSTTTKYILNVLSADGCTTTDSLTITVIPASLAAGADKTIICGGSETMNPIATYGGNQSNLTWSWSPAIGLSSNNIKTPIASPVQTQAYQVSYSSPEGCTAMDSITIFVSPVSLNAGSDVTKLCGDSVVLNPTTTYPGSNSNLSWTWTPASGLNSPTTQNATAKPSTTTKYILNILSADGCIATDSLTITVTPATLAAGADKTIICGGSETMNPIVTFGGNQSNLTWSWSPAIGLSSTNIRTPTASPVQTQAYQVSYGSPEGCTAMDSITVNVSPVSLNAGTDSTIACGAHMVLFPSHNYPGQVSNLSYKWIPAIGLNADTLENPIARPFATTNYLLNFVSSDGCTSSDSITLSVIPIQISANDFSKTCGDSSNMNAFINSNSNSITYVWSPSTGLSNSNILNPLVNPIYTTTYYLSATDSICIAFDTVIVSVNKATHNPDFTVNQTLFTAPPFAVQYTNLTPNFSDYNFSWSFGDGTILNSNNSNVFHQYSYNGLYSVSLIANHKINQCPDTVKKSDFIFCTGGISCNYTPTILQTSPITRCTGDSVLLSCNTDTSFFYQWKHNGIDIPGFTSSQIVVTQNGSYSVSISQNNGCTLTSQPVYVSFFTPSTPVILAQGVINPCSNDSLLLHINQAYNSYLWSTGATSDSIWINQSGSYTVTVTDLHNCIAVSAPYVVNTSYLLPHSICLVGVEPGINKNIIVWEKPISNLIDSFKIYKETVAANVYVHIWSQPYSSLSTFIDYSSHPDIKADRYKILAIDTCGHSTPLSNFHKTNHLTINKGIGNNWNLIWDGYEGFYFPTYNIYRGNNKNNMALIGSIQSNLTSYTDNPGGGKFYYQIEVVNLTGCNPSKTTSSSFSNIVETDDVGILKSENNSRNITIIPNPNQGIFSLVIDGLSSKELKISIYNVNGSLVYCETIWSGKESFLHSLDLGYLPKGVYFLSVQAERIHIAKLVIY